MRVTCLELQVAVSTFLYFYLYLYLSVQELELREYSLKLRVAVCTCLTELVVSDTNAQHVVQSNGIYSLALLLLPQGEDSVDLQVCYTVMCQ